MEEALTVAAPYIAVVASAVGLLVALDQLTQRSRMRRIAEWTKQLAEGEDTERADTLRKIRLMATANMVASVMVPPRFYLECIFAVLLVPYLVLNSFGERQPILMFLTSTGYAWFTLRRGIRIYLERYRVSEEYWRGVSVAPPRLDMLHQMEGGTPSEFLWAGLLSTGLVAASFGVAMVREAPNNVIGLGVVVIGLGLLYVGAAAVLKRTPPLLRP